MSRASLALLFALALAATSCAGSDAPRPAAGGAGAAAGGGQGAEAPEADSATIALWHFDETGGTRVADAGRHRLDGQAGLDTRTDFGRIKIGRLFVRATDSFMIVPRAPVLETPRGFTLETWVRLDAYGPYELTPIGCRWTERGSEQSWLFGVIGEDIPPDRAALPSPGRSRDFVGGRGAGTLVFAYLPEDAGAIRLYYSSSALELGRWTHVAVVFDGEVVRFFIDDQLDAQFASTGRIRPSAAPLVIANWLDWRWLSAFGGDVRVDEGFDKNPYYALPGMLDEMRLSNVARSGFPHARYVYEKEGSR